MEILKTIEDAYDYVSTMRRSGAEIGLVPTMGALHDGHLSLVDASRERCGNTVATIFVNPTQFAPGEDLDQYPRTLESDLDALRRHRTSAVFVPDSDAMFPRSATTFVAPPEVAEPLEGEFRPTFFRGVTTVVLKLFNILPATHAFFGQKDFQQLRVITTMVRDLNLPIQIVPCPIVRERDGLAMSSRNRYLNPKDRARALRLSEALMNADTAVRRGERNPSILEQLLRDTLEGTPEGPGVDSIDYAKVVDSVTLRSVDRIDAHAVALVAAHVGTTRLIDNLLWTDL